MNAKLLEAAGAKASTILQQTGVAEKVNQGLGPIDKLAYIMYGIITLGSGAIGYSSTRSSLALMLGGLVVTAAGIATNHDMLVWSGVSMAAGAGLGTLARNITNH